MGRTAGIKFVHSGDEVGGVCGVLEILDKVLQVTNDLNLFLDNIIQ